MQTQILIVEDEPAVAGLIATTLRMAQFEVTIAQNAQQAIQIIQSTTFDAIVVDWMMPQMSGLELVQTLRLNPNTRSLPVLMLTAKALENDKVMGLDAGADDYLTKPFSPRELTARLKALLRRAQPLRDDTTVKYGTLSLNPSQAKVMYHLVDSELIIQLSHTEFKLLHCMMLQPNRVHSREHLLAQAWDHAAHVDIRTIDAHIKRLRQALALVGCPPYIQTVRGMGYQLQMPDEP